jgi:hypothetical protein
MSKGVEIHGRNLQDATAAWNRKVEEQRRLMNTEVVLQGNVLYIYRRE